MWYSYACILNNLESLDDFAFDDWQCALGQAEVSCVRYTNAAWPHPRHGRTWCSTCSMSRVQMCMLYLVFSGSEPHNAGSGASAHAYKWTLVAAHCTQ